MTHKLKVLGLALCAVFAFSAVAAQGAWAVDTFTSSTSPVTVSGTSPDNVFKLTGPGVQFNCAKSSFSATFSSGASSITATPTYTGTPAEPATTHCESSVGQVTIDMNGCTYDLTGSTTGSDPTGTDATVSITCPINKEIEITNSLCNVFVHEQTPTSGGVTYQNVAGTPKKVKVTATATGITYRSSGSFCAFGGIPSEANDADYTGTVTVGATNGTTNIEVSAS